MPVHFKNTTSEYSQKFCPLESRSYDAATSGHREAGIKSDHIAKCYEPPLQHKKRLEGPPTSLSANYFSGPSRNAEFALLGQQDKFAANVPYQMKGSASSSKIYKNKENFDDPTPPSKQLKMQKRIKPLLKERHPPVARSPRIQPATEPTPKSPPLAPRQEKMAEPVKEALKDKDLKEVLGDDVQKEAKTVPSKEAKAPASNMNEFVQTDMKKGLAISGSEAPADFALKYKAGVAPPRPPKRFSEYQKQFQWKKGMKASPLLAAEQVVYRSSTELGPYKTEPYSKVSEYKRQFQPWKPIEINDADLNLKLDASSNSGSQEKAQPKKKRGKRSKSAGAVLRNENPADAEQEEDKDEAADVKQKLTQVHGKIRRLGTEYRANFKSPTNFHYSQGAWKGANPPQLTPAAGDCKVEKTAEKEDTNNPPLDNWFAEVIELRRRAEEYRKRAQGTHFSREHLVQLMARQTECWDINSQPSATVQALDLEVPKMVKRQAESRVEDDMPVEGDSPVLSEADEASLDEPMEELQAQKTEKKKRRQAPRSRKMAYLEEQREKVAEQQLKLEAEAKMEEDTDINGVEEEDDSGRKPTPILQQEKGSVRRHHLDLTTPSVGGALLTCPPSKNSKMVVTSRSGDSYVTASDDFEVKQSPKKNYNLDKLVTMPILGMPSGDTHCLRDDDAEEDKFLETQYVHTPLPCCEEDDKENDPEQKVRKKKSKRHASKPSQLSSVQENHGKTFYKSNPSVTLDDIKGHRREPEDDVVSVSMMSVASSSSLASEVLERARRRREEFWGKKD